MTYANAEWFRITGIAELGVDCDHWLDRVEATDAPAVRAAWEAALRDSGTSFSREFRFRRASDGTSIVVWINGKSVADIATAPAPHADRGAASADHVDQADPTRSVIGAFTDVTHWRELEQQQIASLTAIADGQERRAADIDASRREQERFVDVVCHEIRNPLNGIVNNVEQIRAQRQVLRPKLVAALAADPSNALLQSILAQEDEEAGMLDAIDLCTSHQV